jgi:predicted GNAT family N-acyltransferase
LIRENYFVDNVTALQDVHSLLTFDERITFILFELILSEHKVYAWSDHKSFIICQPNDIMPIWAWFADDIDENAVECAADIIAARILQDSNIQLNACSQKSREILELACEKSGVDIEKIMDLNAYACKNLIEPEYIGEAGVPTKADRNAMTELITEFVEDAEHQIIPLEEAEGFAESMINCEQLSLWKVDGEVCAMAMIAQNINRVARINSVVTFRQKRGKGYAKMLIADICRRLLDDGVTPMLYADAQNKSSNSVYQNIGFVKTGEVTQYKFRRKPI